MTKFITFQIQVEIGVAGAVFILCRHFVGSTVFCADLRNFQLQRVLIAIGLLSDFEAAAMFDNCVALVPRDFRFGVCLDANLEEHAAADLLDGRFCGEFGRRCVAIASCKTNQHQVNFGVQTPVGEKSAGHNRVVRSGDFFKQLNLLSVLLVQVCLKGAHTLQKTSKHTQLVRHQPLNTVFALVTSALAVRAKLL